MTHATSQDDPLQGVSEVAEQVRATVAAAALAREAGRATSTITRHAHLEVLDWSARDVLRIARVETRLRDALVDYLAGREVPTGDAESLAQSLVCEVDSSNAVARSIRAGLADGVLSPREIDDISAALVRRVAADQELLRNLHAGRRGARS